jgi:uncharacterized protein
MVTSKRKQGSDTTHKSVDGREVPYRGNRKIRIYDGSTRASSRGVHKNVTIQKVKKYPLKSEHSPPWYITLGKSAIAGTGAYALVDIPKGNFIAEYTGKVLSLEESHKKKSHYAYYMDVTGKTKRESYVIDGGNRAHSGWARFINCPRWREEENTEYIQRDKRMFVRTIRAIPAGEELTSWYGNEYGKRLTGFPEPPTRKEFLKKQ